MQKKDFACRDWRGNVEGWQLFFFFSSTFSAVPHRYYMSYSLDCLKEVVL